MLRLLSTLLLLASTHAYRQDLAKLPNGNSYGLTLGHPGGTTSRTTKIASSFYAMGQTWNKAFCLADADGDGQSNGLEMGDPCCKWSPGQVPQFTTGLSDPNSAASTTMTPMPPCIMSYAAANAKLQCAVCVQALQLDMVKPSDNAAEFSLTSVKACKDATQDDEQKILCVAALIKNADQLLMDQKNGVAPLQSCMNLGLICMAPPTQPPTPTPTQAPTSSPTQPPMPTQAPTVAPTQQPTAPPPPRKTVSYESSEMTIEQSTDSAMDAILVPVLASAGGSILLTFLIWRICKRRNEVALNADTDFHAMPDVRYARTA
jgi:hypothetical protein